MPDTAMLHDSSERVSSSKNLWSVRDESVPVKFVDMITECRHHNNIAHISLGSAIMDLNGSPKVDVATRLRFDLATARNLHAMLGTMIAEMLRTQDRI